MRRSTSLATAATALALCTALSLGDASAATNPPPGTASQVKALVAASVKIKSLTPTLSAKLPAAGTDTAGLVFHIPSTCLTPTSCVYGDTTGAQSIVLFGDSHARMWLPAVNPIAMTDHLKVILISVDGCLVIGGLLSGSNFGGCRDVRVGAINTINGIKPVGVILSNRTTGAKISSAQWQAGMLATIKALAPSKAKVAIIGDVQTFNLPVLSCLAAFPSSVQKNCAVANPNKKAPGRESAEKAAAKAAQARYVDPTPWMCAKTCSPVLGSFIGYWDTNHVTASYAAYLSRVMGIALKPVL